LTLANSRASLSPDRKRKKTPPATFVLLILEYLTKLVFVSSIMKFRIIALLAFSACAHLGFGGIKWVDVGVNGLTCSMCTRSVEMSLRRLEFVDSIIMSLETSEGRIYFRENTPINLNDIAKAITNAGFSVRFVKLQMSFDDIAVDKDGSFIFQGQTYKWLDFPNKVDGTVGLKLVDENFLPKKESAALKKKFAALKSDDKTIFHVVQG
jgi:hypothetical protein